MSFVKFSPDQEVKIKLWKASLPPSLHNQTEKRFFTKIKKTTIGDEIYIVDKITNKEFDATEYEKW